jgi:hypothetical protein
MSKKKKRHQGGRTLPQVWTPFMQGQPMRNGQPAPEALIENETLWFNSHYVVHRHLIEGTEDGAIHLSIRDNKRRAVRDWRHFQRIKNELAGYEREAIEIFPPESQLVDTANQYHLFERESQPHLLGRKEDMWTQQGTQMKRKHG